MQFFYRLTFLNASKISAQAQRFERLSQSPEQILSLAGAADELERYLAKKDQLQQELKELEDGTRTAELNVRRETLEREVEDLERKIKSVNEERIGRAGDKRIAESEQKSYEERLSLLQKSVGRRLILPVQTASQVILYFPVGTPARCGS